MTNRRFFFSKVHQNQTLSYSYIKEVLLKTPSDKISAPKKFQRLFVENSLFSYPSLDPKLTAKCKFFLNYIFLFRKSLASKIKF